MNTQNIVKYFPNGNKKDEKWLKNNLKHNFQDNFQAGIEYFENGNKYREYWCLNGYYYRKNNLPSMIVYHQNGNKYLEIWFRKNDLDNLLIPSIIEYDNDGKLIHKKYFFNNKEFNKFKLFTAIIKLKNYILKFKIKKRNDLLSKINQTLIISNGNDITNLITLFSI